MKKREIKPLLKVGTVIEAMTTLFGNVKATITDIKTITYERNETTEFMYEFENTGEYIKVDEMTGDKLFEMKSKCYGAVSAEEATKCFQKTFGKISETQQYEQDMLSIKTLSGATDNHINEVNALIKTICEHESIETMHLVRIIRNDLASGKTLESILEWLHIRVENYSESAGA